MDIRQEYDMVKSTLTVVAPFISSLLSRVRIILTDRAETACVTEDGVMAVSPKFWSGLSWAGKAWVLAHEALHVAFRDHKRLGGRNLKAWNYVADALNNHLEREFLRMPRELRVVALDDVWYALQKHLPRQMRFSDFEKLSKEEIYRLLPRAGDSCSVLVSAGGIEVDLGVDVLEGEVLQEGDPEIYRDGRESDGEDVDEKWKNRVAVAYDLQKSMGTVSEGLKRVVDGLLKPKVNWTCLLRQAFRVGFGRTVVSTWRRPSRKSPDFPGLRRYTYPAVWCLVDMSGSISDREAEQFLSEVYSIAGDAKVNVVVWDVKVYDVVEAKSQAEVVARVVERLRGGGGTVVKQALDVTLKRMKGRDIVVLFSDMDIQDLDKPETRVKFSEVALKASVAILCSTDREVHIEGWRFVKLEVD